jgi:hypothetical protein
VKFQCFLGIFVCSQSGYHPLEDAKKSDNHPLEDLAKFGNKPDMKVQYFSHPFIILARKKKSKSWEKIL